MGHRQQQCSRVKASPPAPVPPTYGPQAIPKRLLLDHWAEYIDKTGRKYYFNCVTRESSWKPPRRETVRPRLYNFSRSVEDLADVAHDGSSSHHRSRGSNDDLCADIRCESFRYKPQPATRHQLLASASLAAALNPEHNDAIFVPAAEPKDLIKKSRPQRFQRTTNGISSIQCECSPRSLAGN